MCTKETSELDSASNRLSNSDYDRRRFINPRTINPPLIESKSSWNGIFALKKLRLINPNAA